MRASLLALCAAVLLAGCDTDGGDAPGLPGRIVFSARDAGGTFQIFTMDADGSRRKQLTSFPRGGSAFDPAWSPDGTRIAFATGHEATTLGPSLYVMDADGRNMRPLKRLPYASPTALVGEAPAWSPDGTRIAYQVCTNCELEGRNYQIVVVEVAGEEYDPAQVHGLTDDPHGDFNPSWSPDGRRVVFSSDRAYADADSMRYRRDLYAVDVDGTHLERLTKTGNADIPSWGPIGDLIAYANQHHDPEIFMLDLSTLDAQKVTNLKYVGRPMWSRDGSRLLVPATTEGDDPVFQCITVGGEAQSFPRKIAGGQGFDWHEP